MAMAVEESTENCVPAERYFQHADISSLCDC